MILNKNELLWLACLDDLGRVHCNLCGLPVEAGSRWHESHVGAPKALGGRTVGVAHDTCNLDHGSRVVTPMVAKAKRQFRKHNGITGPGLGKRPMPGGRRSKWKKKMDGSVVLR